MAILGGCGLVSPKEERVPSVIEYLSPPLPFVFGYPDTVTAGQEFDVRLRTYAGGCREPGSVGVERSSLVITLRPEDVRVSGGRDCPANLQYFAYDVTLRFDNPGSAVIRVLGVVKPSGDHVEKEVPVVVKAGADPIGSR
ncbi:MAG: hypothetical protein RLN75_00355 [Longimicrobiales bacterium]